MNLCISNFSITWVMKYNLSLFWYFLISTYKNGLVCLLFLLNYHQFSDGQIYSILSLWSSELVAECIYWQRLWSTLVSHSNYKWILCTFTLCRLPKNATPLKLINFVWLISYDLSKLLAPFHVCYTTMFYCFDGRSLIMFASSAKILL